MTASRNKIYRIIDVNFNRSREGIRVLEEVVRFAMDSTSLQRDLKECRHCLADVFKNYAVCPKKLLSSRNSDSDVGKESSKLEEARLDLSDIFMANAQRVKESLRALEEFSKLIDLSASRKIKKIRFDVYAIEKKAVPKLETLRDHVPGKNGMVGYDQKSRRGDFGRRRRGAGAR